MKKIELIVIIFILIINGFGITAISQNENPNLNINVLSSEIIVPSPVFIENENFLQIELSNSNSYLIQIGKPMLPKISKSFTFPQGTTIIDILVNYETEWILIGDPSLKIAGV